MRRQSEAGPEVVLEKHELWSLLSTPASRVKGGRAGVGGRVLGLTALPHRTMVPPNLSGSSVAGTAASTQPAEGSGAEGIEGHFSPPSQEVNRLLEFGSFFNIYLYLFGWARS